MKNNNLGIFNQKGFGLIEAVVGIIVALIIVLAFTTLISKTIVYSSINGKQLKATLYLQEMIEAAKDLEQSPAGWDRLTTSTSPCYATCYLYVSGSSWNVNSGTEELESNTYERWLTVEHVYRRDADNEIIIPPCGVEPCTIDPNTKKVIAKIEWMESPGKTVTTTLEAYLYNFNP